MSYNASFTRHLFRPVRGGFLMLAGAYFDESGTDEGAVAHCVAGYIIMEEPAEVLDRLWRAVLKKHGLTSFHMVDCAHGNLEFNGMEMSERIEIARAMIEIIKASVGTGFAVCFNPGAYKLPEKGPGADFYSHAVWMVCAMAQGYVTHHTAATGLALTFEQGHKDMSRAGSTVANFLAKSGAGVPVSSYQFVDKKALPAVQAADLLAWQCLQYVRGKIEGRPVRKDMASLLTAPHDFYHLANGQGGGIGLNHDSAPSSHNERRDAALTAIYKSGDHVSTHNASAWDEVETWAKRKGLLPD